ncbi:unnamed protein product [Litomosoides sigmodontis]|uniref:Selenoprotein K n=1 Tax=Litomosoides sigmodontis TaxID=42156 RepID=A0A3P6TX78_LITSI|nr:unnamed protein product [Litomosoides sigmodontis]
MPYVDSDGNIVESKKSTLNLLWQFFAFFLYFFQTLFGPLIGEAGDRSRHRHGWSGSGRWPGSGGPGGPSRGHFNREQINTSHILGDHGYGAGRRPIGRPAFSSGMSCPPMGGGG